MSRFRKAFKPRKMIQEFIEQGILVSIERLLEDGVYVTHGFILNQDRDYFTFLVIHANKDPFIALFPKKTILTIFENDEHGEVREEKFQTYLKKLQSVV